MCAFREQARRFAFQCELERARDEDNDTGRNRHGVRERGLSHFD
jgi:hypothetical protein